MADAATYYIEVEIDKIPREQYVEFERKDGTRGIKVRLQFAKMKAPDRLGNTHTVYNYRTKNEMADGVERVYCGKGKILFKNDGSREYHHESTEQPF